MSYVLVDELAAIAPHIPTFTLTDVEGTHESARRIMRAAPGYAGQWEQTSNPAICGAPCFERRPPGPAYS